MPLNDQPVEKNPLLEEYFNWLYDHVFAIRDVRSEHSYIIVCDRMHRIKFQALVDHDENRIADGSELRNEFLKTSRAHLLYQTELIYDDSSVFEVLVGLAKRANLMVELPVADWFWVFIQNLNLDRYNDKFVHSKPVYQIDRTINKFNRRSYRANGQGGIFPLKRPLTDQRQLELWYQMGAYMTDNHMY
jgi:hypothetical protein